jgi:hypothetical protein
MSVEIEKGVIDFDESIAMWLEQYRSALAKIKEWEEVADVARSHKLASIKANRLFAIQRSHQRDLMLNAQRKSCHRRCLMSYKFRATLVVSHSSIRISNEHSIHSTCGTYRSYHS